MLPKTAFIWFKYSKTIILWNIIAIKNNFLYYTLYYVLYYNLQIHIFER